MHPYLLVGPRPTYMIGDKSLVHCSFVELDEWIVCKTNNMLGWKRFWHS